jgi:ASC-1-like (ASCH) protein
MKHNLHLVLKHKYYGLIKEGKKRVEYRDLTDYWKKRILDKKGLLKLVIFHKGYTNETMAFQIKDILVNQYFMIEIHLGEQLS